MSLLISDWGWKEVSGEAIPMDDKAVGGFTFNRVGTSGCEIRDPDGNAVVWAADKPWALVIVGLLNRVEAEGLPHRLAWATRLRTEGGSNDGRDHDHVPRPQTGTCNAGLHPLG
jgi:hypothetical protein